ncbi:MAG: ADP-ribosylation/crystallin J1 [Acutalibacteraceae bacterium]
MILYRPVGTAELNLIEQNGYKAFPPRLPEQPIFYPVLNEKYAQEIAERWNTKGTTDHKGYVTQFEVDDEYCSQFEIQTVGRSYHQELWIPADELDNFNHHIIGLIKIIASYYDTEN